MRRLIQIGVSLLFIVAFITPLAEIFDRWDPPGLDNDTEFALFAIVFALCLILLVCKLISSLAAMAYRVALPDSPPPPAASRAFSNVFDIIVPAHSSPPLRI
ncbi:MAG: hypothetical protein NVSMB3_10500 [Acidobacteriaceae bacterium]